MILWFLRLFTVFAEMEESLRMCRRIIEDRRGKEDELRQRADEFQGRCIDLRGTVSDTEDKLNVALNEASELRVILEDSRQQTLRLQDRLDGALEDRARMWSVMQGCISGERVAYQAHINAQWQKQGAGTPYPEAPHLPDTATPKLEPGVAGRAGRILPSEAVQARGLAYLQNYYAKHATNGLEAR